MAVSALQEKSVQKVRLVPTLFNVYKILICYGLHFAKDPQLSVFMYACKIYTQLFPCIH